tara:strand:- start:209 stop:538 length:330 start_codon:yes stop_codon:yes gene_type:complete
MNTLKPETRKIRLEPEYITKYGKSFYEVCLENHKFLNNDLLFERNKKKFYLPFYLEVKDKEDYYYESDDNYYSEEETNSYISEDEYSIENEHTDLSSDEEINIDDELEN